MKTVTLSKQASKALSRMPRNVADTIREKIALLATAPEALANNIKWIGAMQCHRLRVGDYRVFYDDDGQIVAITAIRPRGEAYD